MEAPDIRKCWIYLLFFIFKVNFGFEQVDEMEAGKPAGMPGLRKPTYSYCSGAFVALLSCLLLDVMAKCSHIS